MPKHEDWIEAPMKPLFFEIRISQAEELPNGSYVDPPHFGGVENELIIRPLILLKGAKGYDVVEGIDRFLKNDFISAPPSQWSRGGHAQSAIPEFTLDTYLCRGGELAMDWLMAPGDLVEVRGTVHYEMSQNKFPSMRNLLLATAFLFALLACAFTASALLFTSNDGWYQAQYKTQLSYVKTYPPSDQEWVGEFDCQGEIYYGLLHFRLENKSDPIRKDWCRGLWTDCDYNDMPSDYLNGYDEDHDMNVNRLCLAMDLQNEGFKVKVVFVSLILASFFSFCSAALLSFYFRTGRFGIPLIILCVLALLFSIPPWSIFLSIVQEGVHGEHIRDYTTEFTKIEGDWAWDLSLVAFIFNFFALLFVSIALLLKSSPETKEGDYKKMVDEPDAMSTDEELGASGTMMAEVPMKECTLEVEEEKVENDFAGRLEKDLE